MRPSQKDQKHISNYFNKIEIIKNKIIIITRSYSKQKLVYISIYIPYFVTSYSTWDLTRLKLVMHIIKFYIVVLNIFAIESEYRRV